MAFGFGFGMPRIFSVPRFSPLSLFAASEPGVWYDPSDLTTMFQDAAGTVPVTAVDQPVGRILDKSGNNNHGLPTGATLRSTYDGLLYIEYVQGGGLTVAFSPALGVSCSVLETTPDRQGYQVRTNINIGTSFAITQTHGPILLINRVLSATENFNLGVYAQLILNGASRMSWTRNPSWLAVPTPDSSAQTFVGLISVWPQANFAAITCAGAYTVDWGDGVVENFASGVRADHIYDFADSDLAGSDAPVTLNASAGTVERTAHGYIDGAVVYLYNVVTTTGVLSGQAYYVINATPNDFQISASLYGSPVAMTGNGTATLLPYKQALVTVTPQAGQNLTSVNINVIHPTAGLNAYESGWLDIAVGSPNLTTLTLGGASEIIRKNYVERVVVSNLGSVTNADSLFANMRKLQTVPLFNTQAVTTMGSMFNGCVSLQTVPLFNTQAVTNMIVMFTSCASLQTVPLFNTQAVTAMNNMFLGCSSLQTVPLFNTQAVTNMSSMFNGCRSLQTVPLFNTQAVTNMSSMFNGCVSLQTVPLFNTQAVTNMSSMFQSCASLQTVPLFNTAAVTTMGSMFQSCPSLQTVPLFNTQAVTAMNNMLNGCPSLQTVPALVTTAVSSSENFATMFATCSSLARIEAKDFRFTFSVASCKLSAAALDEIYTNLPTVTGQTITVTGNYGTTGDDPTIATAKGWTVTG